MFAVLSGDHEGNFFIVTNFDGNGIDCLLLLNGGNCNIHFSRKQFEALLDTGGIDFVETIPKDVFSNVHNTWKNNLDTYGNSGILVS